MNKCFSSSGIHAKNLVAILHLMVALAKHFRAPIRLPENVVVSVVVVQVRLSFSRYSLNTVNDTNLSM